MGAQGNRSRERALFLRVALARDGKPGDGCGTHIRESRSNAALCGSKGVLCCVYFHQGARPVRKSVSVQVEKMTVSLSSTFMWARARDWWKAGSVCEQGCLRQQTQREGQEEHAPAARARG